METQHCRTLLILQQVILLFRGGAGSGEKPTKDAKEVSGWLSGELWGRARSWPELWLNQPQLGHVSGGKDPELAGTPGTSLMSHPGSHYKIHANPKPIFFKYHTSILKE